MKKLIIMIMTFALLLGLSLPVLAQDKLPGTIQKQQLNKAQEQASVLKAINNSQFEIKQFFINHRKAFRGFNASETDLTFGAPYRVYVPDRDCIQALMDNKPIAGLLQNAVYFWEVPVLYKGKAMDAFSIDLIESKWQIAVMGSCYLTPDAIEMGSKPEAIIKMAGNNNIKTIDAFTHFCIPALFSDYLLLANEKGEFLYPLKSKVDFGNILTPMTLYSQQQATVMITPCWNKFLMTPRIYKITSGLIPKDGSETS